MKPIWRIFVVLCAFLAISHGEDATPKWSTSPGFKIVSDSPELKDVLISYSTLPETIVDRRKQLVALAYSEEQIWEKISTSKEVGGFLFVSSLGRFNNLVVMRPDGTVLRRRAVDDVNKGDLVAGILETFERLRCRLVDGDYFVEFELQKIASPPIAGKKMTEDDFGRKAVATYPEIAAANSPMNLHYVERVKFYRRENPELFQDPQWPWLIAQEVAAGLGK